MSEDEPRISRRKLLGGIGSAGAASIAGCHGPGANGGHDGGSSSNGDNGNDDDNEEDAGLGISDYTIVGPLDNIGYQTSGIEDAAQITADIITDGTSESERDNDLEYLDAGLQAEDPATPPKTVDIIEGLTETGEGEKWLDSHAGVLLEREAEEQDYAGWEHQGTNIKEGKEDEVYFNENGVDDIAVYTFITALDEYKRQVNDANDILQSSYDRMDQYFDEMEDDVQDTAEDYMDQIRERQDRFDELSDAASHMRNVLADVRNLDSYEDAAGKRISEEKEEAIEQTVRDRFYDVGKERNVNFMGAAWADEYGDEFEDNALNFVKSTQEMVDWLSFDYKMPTELREDGVELTGVRAVGNEETGPYEGSTMYEIDEENL